jgi:hypothetical protein
LLLLVTLSSGVTPTRGQVLFTAPTQLALGGREFSPALSEDELEVVFASDRGGSLDLYDSRRAAIGSTWNPPGWSTPTPVSLVNSTADDYAPELSADGIELYFASTRPAGTGTGSTNLWVARRPSTTATWGSPTLVPGTVNATGVRTDDPRLTRDGLTMFFTVTTTSGSSDIYTVRRANTAPTTPWTSRQPFAPANHPTAVDHSPLPIAGDDVVFFASDRPPSQQSDFWMTWRTGPTSWAAPQHVTELSTADDDGNGAFGARTGAFYSSRTPTGQPPSVWAYCPVPNPIELEGLTNVLVVDPAGLTGAPFLLWERQAAVPVLTTPQTMLVAVRDWRCPPPPQGLVLAGFARLATVQHPFPLQGVAGVLALAPPVLTIAPLGIPASGTARLPITVPPDPGLRGLRVYFQHLAVSTFTPLAASLSQVLRIELR